MPIAKLSDIPAPVQKCIGQHFKDYEDVDDVHDDQGEWVFLKECKSSNFAPLIRLPVTAVK